MKITTKLLSSVALLAATSASAAELEVTHWWTSGGEAAAVTKIAEAFNAKTDNTWIDGAIAGGGGTSIPAIISRIIGGDPMGATQLNHGRQAQELIEAGMMTDLTDLAEAGGWRDIVHPVSLLDSCTVDGRVYCVPMNIHSAQWLWVSHGAFEKAGLPVPTNWDEFVAFTVDAGLTGVEALSGIPGCVGAAPVQNIGAYGQEVAETITRLEFVEYPSGEIRVLEASELGFGYRDSIFKRGCQGVITWVEFELREGSPASLDRLTQAIGREVSTSAEIRREVLATRAVKGMVLDDADRDTYSCGSFFTNPIVSEGFALGIPSEAPRWLQADGTVKLSAAWLIENSGLRKGFSLGASKAAISTKHSLAITNRGGASGEEVAELARFIQHQVSNRWGINLVPEPNLIGF